MITKYADLKDKPILVTGALRGIGRTICKALAENQAQIILNFRSRPEEAEAFAEELKSLGATAVHLAQFDQGKPNEIKACLEPLAKEIGPFRGIVNNAGISKDSLLLRLKSEEVDQVIDTNLKGPINIIQSLSRSLLRAESCSIINMSSIVGLMGNAGQISYASSKAGLIGLTKSVAKELGSRKIRCNAICPGFIATEMTDELDEKTKDAYKAEIALGDFGSTEDVANLVNFLLSDSSAYITGEVIKIDGGMYI